RRADTKWSAQIVHERLARRFGKASVFMDVHDILPGVDWAQRLRTAMQSCNILLVMIDKRWLNSGVKKGTGQRRLDDEKDHLRKEIEAALTAGLMVIPVLVDGATMPRAEKLPEALQDMATKQAVKLRPDPDMEIDIERLI